MSIWRSFWEEQGCQERILLVKLIQLLTGQLVVQVTKQLVVRVTKLLVMEVTKLLVVQVTKLSMAHLVEHQQPRKSSAGTARHLVANQLNSKSARVAGR